MSKELRERLKHLTRDGGPLGSAVRVLLNMDEDDPVVGLTSDEAVAILALLAQQDAPRIPGGFRVVADPTVPRDEIHWRDADGVLLGKITDVHDGLPLAQQEWEPEGERCGACEATATSLLEAVDIGSQAMVHLRMCIDGWKRGEDVVGPMRDAERFLTEEVPTAAPAERERADGDCSCAYTHQDKMACPIHGWVAPSPQQEQER